MPPTPPTPTTPYPDHRYHHGERTARDHSRPSVHLVLQRPRHTAHHLLQPLGSCSTPHPAAFDPRRTAKAKIHPSRHDRGADQPNSRHTTHATDSHSRPAAPLTSAILPGGAVAHKIPEMARYVRSSLRCAGGPSPSAGAVSASATRTRQTRRRRPRWRRSASRAGASSRGGRDAGRDQRRLLHAP